MDPTVRSRIAKSFLEEMEILEKGASIKGVVKGTMLAGATAAGLGAAGTAPWWALGVSPSARATQKRIETRYQKRVSGQIGRRSQQAQIQSEDRIKSLRKQRVQHLKNFYMSGDPKHKKLSEGVQSQIKSLRSGVKAQRPPGMTAITSRNFPSLFKGKQKTFVVRRR